MNLVTVNEAATALHVSSGLVRHWVRHGWLDRHFRARSAQSERKRPGIYLERFYVDLDAARVLTSNGALDRFKLENPNKNFLTARQVARTVGVTYHTVVRMLKILDVTKYHYHNDSPAYVVDGEELHSKMEDHPTYSLHLYTMRLKKLDF